MSVNIVTEVMVSNNDPVDHFLNSVQVVKDVFSPIESGIRKAAKDLEHSWLLRKNGPSSGGGGGGANGENKFQGFSVCRKSSQCSVTDEGKKGLDLKVPFQEFLGLFPHNSGGDWLVKDYKHSSPQECKPRASFRVSKNGNTKHGGNNLPAECFIGFICNLLSQNLRKFHSAIEESECESTDYGNQFNCFRAVTDIFGSNKEDLSVFLGNLGFAKVGGAPSSIVGVSSDDDVTTRNQGECEVITPQKLADELLCVPISNVERLRSTLSAAPLTELVELLPNLGRSTKDCPDKKKLFSVQDFFRYTESEGKRFFEELDRDCDGQVSLEDLEVAMLKRNLPRKYARGVMRRTRSHLFSKSFGWKQFLSLMEQKESTILRAYTTLCLSKSGTLQKGEILTSLKNAGLPANEDNAMAMMRFLNADTGESISYGHFRNFMLLLPSDRLEEDPRNIWFKASTFAAAAPPPLQQPVSSVFQSALAGGLSCSLSCAIMHPIDTIKTQVQASTLSFPEIIAKVPQIGLQGVYRGSIPSILGQFFGHGLRIGICEAFKFVLVNVAPTMPELQVQSIASFSSTVLGTISRVPSEVLKQRLQAGVFDNLGEAIVGTWNEGGFKGFFRGTGVTLFREVPFYVAGMGLYAQSKKVAQLLVDRELEPWETVVVGAVSGGLTAILTTPFDVIKTRMMIAPGGHPVSMSVVALSILRHEGPLGLFRGAVPRFFWVAPLGAMNFAGYELIRKALEGNQEQPGDSNL